MKRRLNLFYSYANTLGALFNLNNSPKFNLIVNKL